MHTDKSEIQIDILNSQNQSSLEESELLQPKKTKLFLINSTVAIAIYLLTFFGWYYFKRSTLILEDRYLELLGYYLISLFVASILSNKVFLTRKHEYLQSLRKIYISVLLALGLLSLILLITDASTLSRYVILGSMLSGSILESIYFYVSSENKNIKRIIQHNPISYLYTIPDFIFLSFSIYYLIVLKIGFTVLNERHILAIILIFTSWIYSALFTHRFNPVKRSVNNWAATGLQFKFYLLILSSTALLVFTINIKPEYAPYFLNAVIIYSIISFAAFLFLYVRKLPYPTDEVTNVFLRAFEIGKPVNTPVQQIYTGKYKFLSSESDESNVKQKMQFQYLKDFPEVFNFLERELELKSFEANKVMVIRSSDIYNVEVLVHNCLELFVNLHEINDLKRINDYFRLVNDKIAVNGIYVGCLIPIKNRHTIFQKKYPFLISTLFYFADFIWRRVFPKIPVLRKFYFTFSKGRDRAISLAEALGRLVYCGFEIIDLTEINEFVFFVAKKIKGPSTDTNPSYSPIFKMRRVGMNGKQIFVYKIRTMHPYSEYLQEFIYDRNKLSEGGKFKDDFRIPGWGRTLRKLWIDELPMLINLVRGEIKLVGVRPVSNHYLGLYSDEFRARREKYKPGLIPPFYADMPKTIEEIELSEKKYFDLYDSSPFITDLKYFFIIITNILFKKKRSA